MGSHALGVNNEGVTVGFLDGCPDPNRTRAFVWWPDGQVEVLDLPDSWAEQAVDVNDGGEIALKVSFAGTGEGWHPALWLDGALVNVFDFPRWANTSDVRDINNLGAMAGEFGNVVVGPYPLAATWTLADGMEDLSSLFPKGDQRPTGINDSGAIAGYVLGPVASPPGEDSRRAF